MRSSKLIRMWALGAGLASAVALAGDPANSAGAATQLNCPAGTKQFGTPSEGSYCGKTVNQQGDNVPHGPFISYHPNGQKRSEGQYVEGFRSGTWTFFDESGKQTRSTEFGGDARTGKRVQYFASGKPHIIEEYVSGKRHGLMQEFSQDGKLVREVQYRDDKQAEGK